MFPYTSVILYKRHLKYYSVKVDTGLTIKNHLTERHSEIDDFRERVHTTFGAPLKRTVLHKEKNVELTVTSN